MIDHHQGGGYAPTNTAFSPPFPSKCPNFLGVIPPNVRTYSFKCPNSGLRFPPNVRTNSSKCPDHFLQMSEPVSLQMSEPRPRFPPNVRTNSADFGPFPPNVRTPKNQRPARRLFLFPFKCPNRFPPNVRTDSSKCPNPRPRQAKDRPERQNCQIIRADPASRSPRPRPPPPPNTPPRFLKTGSFPGTTQGGGGGGGVP